MAVNPLAYGASALRRLLLDPALHAGLGGAELGTSLTVLAGSAALLLGLAAWVASRPAAR